MAPTEILGLQWLEHPNIFNKAIVDLRNKSTFTDATLACEGKFYPVHKFVLSTCSEYFSAIFEWTPCVNPVVVINNISSHNLEPLLDFMYRGETNVQECFIQDVMKAAECLDIKGLSLRQEESNYARNRPKSPVNSDEPKKKRRKSESKKKMSFLKPQLQSEGLYGQQVSSPLQASTASVRPTTPLHQTSPHHTPPMHSPSLHSASPHPSPHPLSSAASSPSSQPSLQPVSLQIPSPKPHLSPMPHLNTQNQFLKTISPFREASTSNSLQLQASTSNSLQLQASTSNSLQLQASTNSSLQMQASQQPIEVFSSHHRDHFSCLKDDQSNFPVSTIPGVVSSREPTILPVSQEVSHSQFRKFTPSVLPERIMHEAGIPHEVVQSGSSNLTHMDQKMIGIGEELHLEGPVKELEIATEDGTVSIPEILEGLVDMRHLYDSKVIHHEGMQNETFSHDSKPSGLEVIPQCSTSGPPVNLLTFKEETNESMYDFTEEFQEDPAIAKMKLIKEKSFTKVYSNHGSSLKRKFNSDSSDHPSTLAVLGEASKAAAPSSSSSSSSSPPSSAFNQDSKEDTKEDPKMGTFVCDTCARTFKKRDALTRHMRMHTEFPYTCTMCDHKCKVYKEFIAHRKTHATKRCDKCDFVTIRTDNLRRHMVKHSEEKSHKCPHPECAYAASRPSLLSIHVQKNHVLKKKARKEPK